MIFLGSPFHGFAAIFHCPGKQKVVSTNLLSSVKEMFHIYLD